MGFRRLVVGDTAAPEEENRSRREGDKTSQKKDHVFKKSDNARALCNPSCSS